MVKWFWAFIDWISRIQTVVWLWALVTGIFAGGLGFQLNAPNWAILALGIAGACIAIGMAILWQSYKGYPQPNIPELPGYGYRVVTGIEKHEWAGDVATKTYTSQEVTHGAPRPKEIRDEFISMKEAATIAYEELRECRSVYAWAAEKLGPSSTQSRAEGTLDWFVYFLPSRISLFGKRPPSRKLELIDPQEFRRGGFNDLGQSFSYFGEKEPRYTDLMVKRDDLDKLIEFLRKDKLGS